jgi:hypothetical protein
MQGPCAAWVEKGCAAVLLQHFLLGFELDLYQPKEFCMIYWYAPDIPKDTCHQVSLCQIKYLPVLTKLRRHIQLFDL